MFFAAGIPLYLSVPYAANMAAANPGSVVPLGLFYGSTMVIFTMYGGGFATIPAYLADVSLIGHSMAICHWRWR